MITPTHILFGATLGVLSGHVQSAELAIICIGAILPDIDSPQSFIGRIFLPISERLYKKFGHRKFIHSLVLWFPISILCWRFHYGFLLCIGVWSHLFLDLFNRSGIELLSPLTSKIFVCLGYKNRIQTGTKPEMILIALFIISLFGSYEMAIAGGPRMTFARLIGTYSIAYDRYIEAGDRICYLNCKIRQKSGSTFNRKFLIVGTTPSGLALYDEDTHQIYTNDDFQILSAYLTITAQAWNSIKIRRGTTLDMASKSGHALGFWYDEEKKEWKEVKRNEPVSGLVIYDEGGIEVKSDDKSDIFNNI